MHRCFFTGAALIPSLLYGQVTGRVQDFPNSGQIPRRLPVQATGCTTQNEPPPQQLGDDDFIALDDSPRALQVQSIFAHFLWVATIVFDRMPLSEMQP